MSDQSHDEYMNEYRDYLIKQIELINLSYDRLMTALTGGALGITSIIFLQDATRLSGAPLAQLLFWAWIAFIVSLFLMFVGLFFGFRANQKAIRQVDSEKIYQERVGGWFSMATRWSRYLAPIFLIIGLVLIAFFLGVNTYA